MESERDVSLDTRKSPEIRRAARRLAYAGTAVRLYEDTMEMPDGHRECWDYVEHRGGACVVALTENNELILVEQYRNGIGGRSMELPGGARNFPEEELSAVAERELEEETGFRAGKLEKLIEICPDPSICSERIGIFLAENLTQGKARPDPGEAIRLHRISFQEALRLVKKGEIRDAKTVAGILACCNHCG